MVYCFSTTVIVNVSIRAIRPPADYIDPGQVDLGGEFLSTFETTDPIYEAPLQVPEESSSDPVVRDPRAPPPKQLHSSLHQQPIYKPYHYKIHSHPLQL